MKKELLKYMGILGLSSFLLGSMSASVLADEEVIEPEPTIEQNTQEESLVVQEDSTEYVYPRTNVDQYPVRITDFDRTSEELTEAMYEKAGVTQDQVKGDVIVQLLFTEAMDIEGMIPDKLTVHMVSFNSYLATQTVTADNNWQVTFYDIPRIDAYLNGWEFITTPVRSDS